MDCIAKSKSEVIDEFNKLYLDVFAEDGSVKNCGRVATSKLISLANIIKPEENFGDILTGFMNINSIKMLHEGAIK